MSKKLTETDKIKKSIWKLAEKMHYDLLENHVRSTVDLELLKIKSFILSLHSDKETSEQIYKRLLREVSNHE